MRQPWTILEVLEVGLASSDAQNDYYVVLKAKDWSSAGREELFRWQPCSRAGGLVYQFGGLRG